MGRGMLIIITGMFVIFGIIQLGVFDRQSNINELNVSYFSSSQARNMANAGIENAFAQLAANPSWRTTPGSPQVYNFRDDRAEVTVQNAPSACANKPVLIRSAGFSGDETSVATALLQASGGVPCVDAAMGIFTENLDFNISGSAFLISGNDVNPDGTPGPEGNIPGIAVNSEEAYDEIMSELNSSQKSKIQGSDPDEEAINSIGGTVDSSHPSLNYSPDMDPETLETFVANALINADAVYDNFTASGEGSLGTPENPQVIVVNGTLDVQNATGAGVLIITESGLLDARGNFDNYQGLIIVQGSADMTRGNINIFGSMLFGGENPQLEIDIDFRGNVSVQYSSQVLANINDQLYSSTERTFTIASYID